MTRVLSCLFWAVVFLLIVLAVDQLLLRVPASQPTHAAIATFYRDLRGRLLDLALENAPPGSLTVPKKPALPAKAPPASIEAVIEQQQPHKAAPDKGKAVKTPAAEPAARYLYADEQGTLHFAATLAEIPEQYRDKASLMGE